MGRELLGQHRLIEHPAVQIAAKPVQEHHGFTGFAHGSHIQVSDRRPGPLRICGPSAAASIGALLRGNVPRNERLKIAVTHTVFDDHAQQGADGHRAAGWAQAAAAMCRSPRLPQRW